MDDIVFDQSPSHTFQHHDGPITYVEYYKKQYNIDVQDLKQPLLLSRKEIQISGEPEKREYIFCMLPELCYMTGLTDKMRKNYTVMKDLATYTKLTPYQRVLSYKKYVENVNSTPEAKSILNQWGLSIDSDLTKITARLLDEERILFGHGKDVPAGPQADFSRHGKFVSILAQFISNVSIHSSNNESGFGAHRFTQLDADLCENRQDRSKVIRRHGFQGERTDWYESAATTTR